MRSVQVAGEAVAISARRDGADGRWVVTLGDRTLRVEAVVLADGALRVRYDDGRTARLAVSVDAAAAWVSGPAGTVRVVEAEAGAAGEGGHAGDLEAPMPGKVLAVACAPGDSVAAGTVLIIVEAMKMEHAIKAPYDGTVTEVRAAEGDLVNPGQRLVELAPDEAASA